MKHLGPDRIRFLVKRFGSAVKSLRASPEEIASLPNFGKKISSSIRKLKERDDWRQELKLIKRYGINILLYTDPLYPKNLLKIPNPPTLLYVMGKLLPEDKKSAAIVGTRQASIYGMEMAEKISYELAKSSYTIVSGLARGIDSMAHRGAIKGGRTIAFVGSGLANLYPSENQKLAKNIAESESGAIISEFPMTSPPEKYHFPLRNRLISGMSEGVLLIEAPIKSGAMITMELAHKQKRKLFALPGRADGRSFQGNHFLIKKKMASLIESAKDIDEQLGKSFVFTNDANESILKKQALPLTFEEEDLWKKMPSEECSIGELVQRTKIPIMEINALIINLTLKKWVKEFPGKIYKKIQRP